MRSCGPWRTCGWTSPASGRSRAGDRRSAVTDAHRPHLAPVVACVDAAHRARPRAHHQRFGRGAAVALVAHALEDVAVGHTGGGEERVLALNEVVAGENPLQVVALGDGRLALLVAARPQAPDQLAA